MCAAVEENDTTFGGRGNGRDHAVKIEHLGLGAEIGIGFDGEADIAEDLVVICPRRRGQIDCRGRLWKKLGEKSTTKMDGTGT